MSIEPQRAEVEIGTLGTAELSGETVAIMKYEAEKRGIDIAALAVSLLTVIAKDDMFNAVLDVEG